MIYWDSNFLHRGIDMRVVFRLITDSGIITDEYIVNEIKYSDGLVGIDIVNIGWRTLTKEQYDTFTVYKD